MSISVIIKLTCTQYSRTFKDNIEVREMLISVDYQHEVKCIEEIAQELELIVESGVSWVQL